MNKDKVFFLAGGGSRLNLCLPIFLKAKIKISGVFISRNENFDEISKQLVRNKIKIFKNWNTFIKKTNEEKNPFIFFISYNKIIDPKIFKSANLINYHASPLPKYRGGSPVNWAIINGEEEFGVSIHELIKSPDAGPILIQEYFSIKNFDYFQVTERVNQAYVRLSKLILSSMDVFWENRLPQDERLVSYYHQRKPENSRINFSQLTSETIFKMFKALPSPLPRPFFKFNRKTFIISLCKLPRKKYSGQPGRVIGNFEKGIVIVCKTGSIVIENLINNKNLEFKANKFLRAGDILND